MRNLFFLCGLLLFGCAQQRGGALDFYFPKQSGNVHRSFYEEKVISGVNLYPDSGYIQLLRKAYRGDENALSQIFQNSRRHDRGEKGVAWVYDCLFLLLTLGDDKFAHVLAAEDAETKTSVGYALDPQVKWDQHSFPKTRALYSYRFEEKGS